MFDHLQKITLKTTIEVWLSLVERYVRDTATGLEAVIFENR